MMRRWILALCIAFSAGCGGDWASDGMAAFRKGDTKTASDLLAIAHEHDPARKDVAILRAVCLSRSRRSTEAEALLRPLVNDPEVRLLAVAALCETLAEADRHKDAVEVAREATRADPGNTLLNEALGIAYADWSDAQFRAMPRQLESVLASNTASWVSRALRDLHALPKDDFTTRLTQLKERLVRTEGLERPEVVDALVNPMREATTTARDIFAACADDPSAFRARLEMGRAAVAAKDVDRARTILEPLLDLKNEGLDPLRAEAARLTVGVSIDLLTELLIAAGKPEDAVAILLPRTKDQSALLTRLAEAHLAAGAIEAADAAIEKSLLKDPRSPRANWIRGRVLEAKDSLGTSIAYYRKAVAQSGDLDFKRSLAFALLKLGDVDQAEPVLRMLAEYRVYDYEPAMAVADLLAKRGDMDDARAYITERLASIGDTGSEAFKKLSAAHRSLHKDVGVGITSLKEGYERLSADENNPWLRIAVANLEFEESTKSDSASGDRTGMALQRIEEVVASNPNIVEGWKLLARIRYRLAERGKIGAEMAANAADVARRLAPDDASAWYEEARAYRLAKWMPRALSSARMAESLAPKEPWARLLRAELEFEAGDAAEAAKLAEALAKEFPDDPRTVRLGARLKLRAKDPAAALALLRPLATRSADDPETETLTTEALLLSGDAGADARILKIAGDANVPVSVRVDLLRNLRTLDRPLVAARTARILLPSLSSNVRDSVERGAILDAWWGGDPALAFAIAQDMSDAGRDAAATTHLLEVLVKERAWSTAAIVARWALSKDTLTPAGLHWALSAFGGVGSIRECEAIIQKMRENAEGTPFVAVNEVALKALAGDRASADALLGMPVPQYDPRASDRLREVLGAMVAAGDPARAERIFEALRQNSPKELDARLAVAEAWFRADAADRAEKLLSAHPQGAPWTFRAACLLAGAKIRIADPAGALAVMQQRSGSAADARDVIADLEFLGGKNDVAYGAAPLLAAIKARDEAAVNAVANRLGAESATMRSAWIDLARRVVADGSRDTATAFVKLHLEWRLDVPGAGIDIAAKSLGALLPQAVPTLDAFRVIAALRSNELAKVPPLILPLLEASNGVPIVQFAGACAALATRSGANVRKFLETLPSPPSDRVLVDAALYAARNGELELARSILMRGKALRGWDLEQALIVAGRLRDVKFGAALLADAGTFEPTTLGAKIALRWLQSHVTAARDGLRKELPALLDAKAVQDEVLAPLLVETALKVGLRDQASSLTAKCMKSRRTDPVAARALRDAWVRIYSTSVEAENLDAMLRRIAPDSANATDDRR